MRVEENSQEMRLCSIVGCKNKQTNDTEVSCLSLTKDLQTSVGLVQSVGIKSIYHKMFLLVLITLKKNVLINHWVYKTFFSAGSSIKRKLTSTAIPTLPHISNYQYLGKLLRLEQNRKIKKK